MQEKTLVIIKPDGVSRKVVGKIISEIESLDLTIEAAELRLLTKGELEVHYAHLVEKPFYHEILHYMTSGPSFVLVARGKNAISKVRRKAGATDPKLAKKDTIRAKYGLSINENTIHTSDSKESAEKEIGNLFNVVRGRSHRPQAFYQAQ